MKDVAYLIVTKDGISRLTKRWPTLARQEVAIQIHVTVPDNVFRSPVLRADFEVPEDRVIQPEIQVEVTSPGVGPQPSDGEKG